MPTSVHIPKPLLEAVDLRAKALRISRNRLIAKALERELAEGADWSPGFFERLGAVDEVTTGAVDDMLAAVRAARRSKDAEALLEKKGRRIEDFDAAIAAHALAVGAVLVTANLDDMVRVPGLVVEDWSLDVVGS